MATSTTSRPAPPVRTCSWTIPPYDTPTGGRVGFLRVTVAGKSDYYRVSLQDRDDMAETWMMAKELPDGRFAEPYTVTLGCSRSYCSCPAFTYHRTCRHCDALKAALQTA